MAIPWQAEQVPDPHLLVLNEPLAAELGLDAAYLRGADGLLLLTGNLVPGGATPVAQAYAGHQFGWLAPRLGDGRALLLGEITDAEGRLRDVHLKGSGRTPFARGGDGRAVVGPMLREYVVSEAMHAMGIPTTRSLAVVATGRPVQRETLLPGAVLTRVASSHLRVGSFQYARATGDINLLRRLADHAIARHFPGAAEAGNPYLALLRSVITAQASLVARWMLVGFVHGVMNTDNMTISGETIDYGPCAFLDAFDPAAVYSSIDETGRYSYGNQPLAAEWNLTRLAESLLPLFHDEQEQAVAPGAGVPRRVPPAVQRGLVGRHAGQTGSARTISTTTPPRPSWTNCSASCGRAALTTHRSSAAWREAARGDSGPARSLLPDPAAFDAWAVRWRALGPDADAMDRVNPAYIPRNHLVEEALDAAAAGDLEPLDRLLEAVTSPYDERPELERYARRRAEGLRPLPDVLRDLAAGISRHGQ